MAHFLPVAKLGVFFLKSAVKPISGRIVKFAKDKPAFINSCVWMAKKNHQMYVSIGKATGNRLPYAERLAEKHKEMTKEQAVEFFTDLMGEVLILGAGVAFIVWEYRRSKKHRKTSRENDEEHSQRLDELENTVKGINEKLDMLIHTESTSLISEKQ